VKILNQIQNGVFHIEAHCFFSGAMCEIKNTVEIERRCAAGGPVFEIYL